ncbi:hypothetical protein JG688_00016732 [Phytophthora aleatoria]|uniref:Uncharacterized protein n=1 Tax=Phytophthora aleatoria TaxID=2496075 RepID=A0A8J5IBT4_9STRA|nr:hypothetical protein JG688_00016732 [Phytophthora aleatoria]
MPSYSLQSLMTRYRFSRVYRPKPQCNSSSTCSNYVCLGKNVKPSFNLFRLIRLPVRRSWT